MSSTTRSGTPTRPYVAVMMVVMRMVRRVVRTPIGVIPSVVPRRIPWVVPRRVPIKVPSCATNTPSPATQVAVPISRRQVVVKRVVIGRITPRVVARRKDVDIVVVEHIHSAGITAVGHNHHIGIVGIDGCATSVVARTQRVVVCLFGLGGLLLGQHLFVTSLLGQGLCFGKFGFGSLTLCDGYFVVSCV